MNRRGFLVLLGAALASPLLGQLDPQAIIPHTVGAFGNVPLALHPDAFSLVMAPLELRVDVLHGWSRPLVRDGDGIKIDGVSHTLKALR